MTGHATTGSTLPYEPSKVSPTVPTNADGTSPNAVTIDNNVASVTAGGTPSSIAEETIKTDTSEHAAPEQTSIRASANTTTSHCLRTGHHEVGNMSAPEDTTKKEEGKKMRGKWRRCFRILVCCFAPVD
jgi:hypothetical protein